MTNRSLIEMCETTDCDDCKCEKECDYFYHIYGATPVVVGDFMRSGIDVIYGLKKIEGEPPRVPVPVKLDEEWLESEVMESVL